MTGWAQMFASLRVVPFRWVWAGALSGNSGRFAVLLVAGWEAFRLGHGSSVWPGMVSLLLLIPSMALGLFAGSVADRRNRAVLAAAGQLVNAAAAAAAAALAFAGALSLPALLLLTAAIGVGNSVQAPAWQSMIPQIVGPERLANAGMSSRIAQQGAEFTGPAIGTAVLTTAGPGAGFLTCVAFYLLGAAMFWHVRRVVRPPDGPPAGTGVLRPIADGLSYVRARAPIATMLVWVGLHCSLTMASIGILPAVATANLRGAAGAYGLLLAAFGIGSVVGPLVMMRFGSAAPAVPTLIASGVLSGAPLVTLGLSHQIDADLLSAALAGAAQAVFMGAIYAANQGAAADAMRGRVASVQLSLTTGAMGLASLGWGALVGTLAAGAVLALPGAAFVLACIPFALRRDRIGAALRARLGSGAAAGPQPLAGAAAEPGEAVAG